jgi:hypothetical protein
MTIITKKRRSVSDLRAILCEVSRVKSGHGGHIVQISILPRGVYRCCGGQDIVWSH